MEGLELSTELAEAGAYRDPLKKISAIACYKCGLLFDIKELHRDSVLKKLTFLQCCWLFHASTHPWCEFLSNGKGLSNISELLNYYRITCKQIKTYVLFVYKYLLPYDFINV